MITTIEYALLAGASYISTRPDINKFPVPQGWAQVSYSPPVSSGFEAAAFGNEKISGSVPYFFLALFRLERAGKVIVEERKEIAVR